MAKRRSFSPQFKTEAVLDLLRGQKTQAQICREREIGADQLSRWRDQLLERLPSVFENGRSKESQFIMVSLKDSVIQKAKLIYGVFPKNGVSHVVVYKDKRMPSIKSS